MSVDRWLERPGGVRVRWRDEGAAPETAPAALPFLLIHGWALDLEVFDLVAAHLRERGRVLRFDRRGYGASTGAPSLEADVFDALALLEAAGVERCAVVGLSQGARVAGALARVAPERIVRVVLDGAPALLGLADEEHEPEIPLEEFRRLARERRAALGEALARHPLLQLVQPTGEGSALLRSVLSRYPATDLLTAHPPAPPSPALLQPAAFLQPTLVLNGEHDSAARLRIGHKLARVLPGAKRVLLANCGHLACLDDAASYSGALLRFQNGDTVSDRSHARHN